MRDMNWMARQIEIREKELRRAIDDLATTHASLEERTRELEQSCRQMQVMAMTDPLTAIANRRCFFDILQGQAADLVCNCLCCPTSLLILDVDRFKAVNDTYGHVAGDKVLQEIAVIIRENTREGDTAARVGGEEYALLLPGSSSRQAEDVARRIRAAVAGHAFVLPDGQQISVTISIGICTFTQFACLERDKLYSFADQALYHAKRSGRNSISVYDPEARSLSMIDCA